MCCVCLFGGESLINRIRMDIINVRETRWKGREGALQWTTILESAVQRICGDNCKQNRFTLVSSAMLLDRNQWSASKSIKRFTWLVNDFLLLLLLQGAIFMTTSINLLMMIESIFISISSVMILSAYHKRSMNDGLWCNRFDIIIARYWGLIFCAIKTTASIMKTSLWFPFFVIVWSLRLICTMLHTNKYEHSIVPPIKKHQI